MRIETPKTEEKIEPIKLTMDELGVMEDLDKIKEEVDKRKKELIEILKKRKKPKSIKREFLKTQRLLPNLIAKIKKTSAPIESNVQEPVLFLMKDNGYVDPIEGVQAGEFIMSTPKGEKAMFLSPDKLVTLKYGEQYIKCWFAYENCMSPYPENPIHNAEMYRKTTQKLAMNWRDRDEATMITAKTKMWLYIIGGIVIALVLLFSTDFGKQLVANFGKQAVTTTAQTIQQASQNASSGAISVG